MAGGQEIYFQYNYCSDEMAVRKNIGFLADRDFKRGYERACQASGIDYGIHWRFQTCLWAAKNALKIPGDFVECGVGRGFVSSGIMEALEWNTVGRSFYLFDTFTGVIEDLCTDAERRHLMNDFGGVDAYNTAHAFAYAESIESVRQNFAEWDHVNLIEGAVPDTLYTESIERVAYLHIDMNCVMPEMAAIEFFWPKLTTGACVLLDDYGFPGYHLQYEAWNDWGARTKVPILTLPTGQGLILKLD